LKLLRKSLKDRKVRLSINKILTKTELCSIATINPNRRAHINTVDYAYSRDYEFCFISYPESQHAQNLKHNTSTAVTVFDSHQPWDDPHQGLQFFGNCREETDSRRLKRLERLYAKRFRTYWKWKKETIEEEGDFRLRFYRFIPVRVKVFDEKVFGEQTWVTVSLKQST
jgi:nitroimidazol reductase NimA-like FMN-containing flavoprotein (pyridoxamine 5'-phosphate oxidase superfamily)